MAEHDHRVHVCIERSTGAAPSRAPSAARNTPISRSPST
jgi:hypothetical protein